MPLPHTSRIGTVLICRANDNPSTSGEKGGLLVAISLGKSPTVFLGFGQLCLALNPTQGLSAILGPWRDRESSSLPLPLANTHCSLPQSLTWLLPGSLAFGALG